MNEKLKKLFENQPPVPYSVVSNMDDSGYDENAVLFFEETGVNGDAYRLYKINDFKDGRDTLVIPSEVNGKPVVEIDNYATKWLEKIKFMYIPSTVKRIGIGVLQNSYFDYVVLGDITILNQTDKNKKMNIH